MLPEAETIGEVVENRGAYIIKPLDSYASRGVYAGIDFSREEWEKLVKEHAGEDYIYQEYCPPYRTENIYLVEEKPRWKNYTNMSGPFCVQREIFRDLFPPVRRRNYFFPVQ